MKRALLSLLAIAIIAVTPAHAYYHYVHYQGRTAPFVPNYEKFDVTTLPNHTVTFFVSDQGPSIYAANDTFGSVLSQIRQAVAAWNSVPYSDLHLAFGGLESYSATSTASVPGNSFPIPTTPGGDVIFIDLPGVIGLGAPTTASNLVTAPNGDKFYPIVRGVVMLSRDTTRGAGASYMEGFFTTAVHEIGHALGLQHTWTASAMSQAVIRNTTRSRPLDADDYAGFSVLYGTANWQNNYGSISGRVTFPNGAPVALASVVAIAPIGSAVSALTDPNGNYRIDGIPIAPSSSYYVYAHPLPPDAILSDESGLRLPTDQNGVSFTPSGAFQTVFAPGTLDPQQVFGVSPGATAVANFTVQPRPGVPAYDLYTYSKIDSASRNYIYSGDAAITPAYINASLSSTNQAVIVQGNAPSFSPVQSVTILGGFAPALHSATAPPQVISYSDPISGAPSLAAYFMIPLGAQTGPRHLIFNFGNDILVLPSGINLVDKNPPVIASATPNQDGSVTIAGAGLSGNTAIYFDGQRATMIPPFTGTDAQGSVTVTPPLGSSGQTVVLTAANPDGQNSMFLQSANPATYTYPVVAGTPQISNVNPTAVPAGISAAVRIDLANVSLADLGQITVGFGSRDVIVRRVWIASVNPPSLLVNITVAGNATIGFSEVSVVSGLQVVSQPGGFQTVAARADLPNIAYPVVNADYSQQTIWPGSYASIFGVNLSASGTSAQVTLNDQPMTVSYPTPGNPSTTQVNFLVRSDFPTGPAILKLNSGSQNAFSLVVQIDPPPPVIIGMLNASGTPLGTTAVTKGDQVTAVVTGLDPSIAPNRVKVLIGGYEMGLGATAPSTIAGQTQIAFVVTRSFDTAATLPLMVQVDGSSGAPWQISVH